MQRRRDPSVIESLLAEPQRFKFFQAVRVLELWFARQEGTRARNAVPAHLRFVNSSSLGFPASEIAGLTAFDKNGQALHDAEGGGARLGWNSFLCTEPSASDRDDASYELHTIH